MVAMDDELASTWMIFLMEASSFELGRLFLLYGNEGDELCGMEENFVQRFEVWCSF